jgi:hypothetical protein
MWYMRVMDRPTREDLRLRSVLVQTGIAIAIALVILLITFVWLFGRLL